MSHGLIDGGRRMMWAAALLLGCGAATADTIVYSNNPIPGDSYTGVGTMPVGSSDWYYTDVRAGGTIGINTNNPRSGNGSVYFETNPTTSSNDKADITYGTGQQLGTLEDLRALSYDWYRDSASANSPVQAPSIRLVLSNGRYLIWEPTYNGYVGALPTDTWQTSDAYNSGNGVFWYSGDLNGTLVYQSYNAWLDDPKLAGLTVFGVNSGVGSGWGSPFIGAVDNISWRFEGSDAVTYNFEAVPEPSSVAMGLIAGVAGLVMAARRRRAS